MAGLLSVRLEKKGHYSLGDAICPLGPRKIYSGHHVAQLAGAVVLVIAMATSACLSTP